ncbi:unnamed protein product [Diamesa tonsa]
MSLFFNNEDGAHLDRMNAEQIGKRGLYLNVKPAPQNIYTNTPPTYQQNHHQKFKNFQNNIGFPSAVKRDAFTANVATKKDVIFECLKPIYNLLRAMGVFPLTRSENGFVKFKLQSPAMAYSLTVFIAIIIYIGYILVNRIKVVNSLDGRFEESVIAYLFIVNILPIIVIPLMWSESKKIAIVFNNWSDFETIYVKTSGRPLVVNLRTKAVLISILLPLLSCASVIVTHITMVNFKVEQIFLIQVIPYCFLDMLTYGLGCYWYFACEALSNTAIVLADDFQKALRHIGPAAMVAQYRSLWLRLSKLTRDTGSATCYTFTFINLYLFLIITLSIYGLMSQISEGFGIKDIGLAITACCSVCLLFFICNEAHYASFNVRTIFQKKLLMVELSWMNTDAQTEVNMFLRATEMNPSNINLGGFFDVNRTLFKSLLATMVTYLVVLLQFQISIPEDPSTTTIRLNTTSEH